MNRTGINILNKINEYYIIRFKINFRQYQNFLKFNESNDKYKIKQNNF